MSSTKLLFTQRPIAGEFVEDVEGNRHRVFSCGMKYCVVERPSGAKMLLNLHGLKPVPKRKSTT